MCVQWVPSENVSNGYPSPSPATNIMLIENNGAVREVTGQEEELVQLAYRFARAERRALRRRGLRITRRIVVKGRHVFMAMAMLANM